MGVDERKKGKKFQAEFYGKMNVLETSALDDARDEILGFLLILDGLIYSLKIQEL